MKKESKESSLNEEIRMLENRQARQLQSLKEQLHDTYQSLQPLNLIRDTLFKAVASPGIRTNALRYAAVITTGFLLKKISISIAKKIRSAFF